MERTPAFRAGTITMSETLPLGLDSDVAKLDEWLSDLKENILAEFVHSKANLIQMQLQQLDMQEQRHKNEIAKFQGEIDELKNEICRLRNDPLTEMNNVEVIVLNEENEISSLSNTPQLDIKQEQCQTLKCEEDTAQDRVKVNGTRHLRKWLATPTMVDELSDRISPISVDSGIQQYNDLSDKSGYEAKRTSFRCEVCSECFLTKGSLLQHLFTHDGAQSFKCAFCKSKFTQQSQLNEHVELNHKPTIKSEKDKCAGQDIATNSAVANGFVLLDDDTVIIDSVCVSETETSCETRRKHRRKRKPFSTQYGPGLELVSTEKVKGNAPSRFQCDLCQKKFKTRSCLYSHQVFKHKKPSQHQCRTCNKYLPTANSLLLHMESHERTRDFLCHVCNKGFSTKGNLTTHLKLHSGQRPFLCQTCGSSFTHRSGLKIHMRVHTGERPYRCETCGRGFTHSNSLKIHKRVHTGEKPFMCDICGKDFTQSCNLKTHMRLHNDVMTWTDES